MSSGVRWAIWLAGFLSMAVTSMLSLLRRGAATGGDGCPHCAGSADMYPVFRMPVPSRGYDRRWWCPCSRSRDAALRAAGGRVTFVLVDDVAWIEARTLDIETVRETFALAARHVLADTATEYHAVITVAELSAAVQQRTKIRQRQAPSLWMGDVLYRVAKDCVRRAEPLLGSLCVGPDGRMSDWYADTVLTVRGDTVTDPEQHAAQERLECYRRHGAELPADGGVPALPPVREVARRSPRAAKAPRTPRAAREPKAPLVRTSKPSATVSRSRQPEPPQTATCPRCFMQLPATGLCDTCD